MEERRYTYSHPLPWTQCIQQQVTQCDEKCTTNRVWFICRRVYKKILYWVDNEICVHLWSWPLLFVSKGFHLFFVACRLFSSVLEFQGHFQNYALIALISFSETRGNNKGSKQGKGLQPRFTGQKLLLLLNEQRNPKICIFISPPLRIRWNTSYKRPIC